jgi:hypothetical protein
MDFARLLRTLCESGVELIFVGDTAATAHGAARLTLDLNVVRRRTPANIERRPAVRASRADQPTGVISSQVCTITSASAELTTSA